MRSHPLHRLSQALRHWRTDTKVSDARFIDAVASLGGERPGSLGSAFLKLEERLADRAWERSLRTFLSGFSKSELTALLHRFDAGAPATAAAESIDRIVASLVAFEATPVLYSTMDCSFPGPIFRGPDGQEPSTGKTAKYRGVYVIELDPACYWMGGTADGSRKQNGRICTEGATPLGYLYVGETGNAPEYRFWKHRVGLKSSSVVKRFGLQLRHVLGKALETHDDEISKAEEKKLAISLREKGWFVHQK